MKPTSSSPVRLSWLLAALLLPQAARAHLVTTGLGPLYDGITHFLVSFEDLLPVIAMSLLAGLNGPQAGRRALFVLPVAWLLGGLAGYAAGVAPAGAWLTAVSALVLGALVAADRRLPVALVGIGGAVFVAVSLLAALATAVQAQATRIAVRVAGSWIAAIGLLMLGWQLKG